MFNKDKILSHYLNGDSEVILYKKSNKIIRFKRNFVSMEFEEGSEYTKRDFELMKYDFKHCKYLKLFEIINILYNDKV